MSKYKNKGKKNLQSNYFITPEDTETPLKVREPYSKVSHKGKGPGGNKKFKTGKGRYAP